MMQIVLGKLEHYILPDTDPRRVRWIEEQRAKSAQSTEGGGARGIKRNMGSKGEATEKYKVEHLEHFVMNTLTRPPDWKTDRKWMAA